MTTYAQFAGGMTSTSQGTYSSASSGPPFAK